MTHGMAAQDERERERERGESVRHYFSGLCFGACLSVCLQGCFRYPVIGFLFFLWLALLNRRV